MAKWIPPGAEKARRTVTRVLLVVWLIAGWIAWGRMGDRFYGPDGAPDYVTMAAGGVALLAAMWGTAKLVDLGFRLALGWRYSEMDQSRYDQAVVADAQRKDSIDRDLRR